MKIYLLKMRVNGIKNISKEIELDFYNKILTNFNPELFKVKAIYGENGSGKTAIVTALNIVKKIVLSQDYLAQQETQSFLREIINKKTKEFFVSLRFAIITNNELDVYEYSITLAQEKDVYEITHETLDVIYSYTKNKGFTRVFEVSDGEIKQIKATPESCIIVQNETMNLLNKCSLLMKYIDIKLNDENMKDGFKFEAILLIAAFLKINTYLDEEDMHEMYVIMNIIRNNVIQNDDSQQINLEGYIDKQIYYLDSKGRDVVDKEEFSSYKKKVKKLESFLKVFKKDLKTITIDKRDDGDNYKCELILHYKGGYSVNREFESTGIKKLIRMYDSLLNASRGGISFIDEMDSNLNDIYLCKLIEYFMYYGEGQLCFTTHNLDPMTILKQNKNAIDFLSNDNKITSWKVTGNAAPDRYYRNGMIENSPFNIEAEDFIGMFGE